MPANSQNAGASPSLTAHPMIPPQVLVLDGGFGSQLELLGYSVDVRLSCCHSFLHYSYPLGIVYQIGPCRSPKFGAAVRWPRSRTWCASVTKCLCSLFFQQNWDQNPIHAKLPVISNFLKGSSTPVPTSSRRTPTTSASRS
jgi:hypothetical protein